MSNYPPGFDIQERARYFGTARSHEQARYFGTARSHEQERETLAERAHYTNDYDKHTDPEVIAWRNNYARKLRALRKAKQS